MVDVGRLAWWEGGFLNIYVPNYVLKWCKLWDYVIDSLRTINGSYGAISIWWKI
jgi:hypothetical protein